MIRKIFCSTLFITLGVLLSTTLLIMGVLYSYFTQTQKEQLQTETVLIAQGVTLEGDSYSNTLNVSGLRITWIDNKGNILYSDRSDATKMDNHVNRKEIKKALEDGYGENTRYSVTLTTRSLYITQRLDDGTIIRLSVTQHNILLLSIRVLQPLALVIILTIFLSIWVTRYTAKRVVAPLNDLNLDQPLQNNTHDEISPLLRRVDYHQKELAKQEALLNQKRSEFDTIISKIKEGIILLDAQCRVISISSAAQGLFQTDQSCLGNDILQITRDLSLNHWLESGLQDNKQEGVLQFDQESCKVLIRPILSNGVMTGLAVLLVDVTEQLQIEKLRHEFTANISHEFKTPLRVVSGYSEMLVSGLVSTNDVPHFAGKIYNRSQGMVQLIEDTISLSHLGETDQIPMEELDIYAITQNVLESLSTKASRRQTGLHLKGQSTTITDNSALIHSVLYDLCDNATTYDRGKGAVDVAISSSEDNVFLEVKDTGIGIFKEEQGRISERFYRIDKSRSRELSGTSLGLSIVKHALKLHDASVRIQSQLSHGTGILLAFKKQLKGAEAKINCTSKRWTEV